MKEGNPSKSGPSAEQEIVVGLLVAPVMADLASQLVQDLPAALASRFSGIRFGVRVAVEPLASAAGFREDLIQVARRRMLAERWTVAVCLTDLPLRVGRRPVTAHLSVTLSVILVSVPALGAIATSIRVRETVLRLLDDLLTERLHRPRPQAPTGTRALPPRLACAASGTSPQGYLRRPAAENEAATSHSASLGNRRPV